MFDYIRGRMATKSPTNIVLESSGIGYLVHTPLSTYDSIPAADKEVKLYIQQFIRDDVIVLYGFATTEEREIFKLLISVSGIGPKIALAILSGSPLNDFTKAIGCGDVKALSRIKGVGKKTAERIILELRESIKAVSPDNTASKETSQQNRIIEDAILALMSLGYVRSVAEKAVDNSLPAFKKGDGVESLIRHALQNT